MLLDQVVNGLTAGSQYALIAAGLALMFGVLQIVNFAHGEIYMVGAYVTYVATSIISLPYAVSALATVVIMALFGVLFYLVIIQRLLNRGWQVQLVATLALSTLLINATIVAAGSLPKRVPSDLTKEYLNVGSLQVSWQRAIVFVCAVVCFTALWLFLTRTTSGKALRAVAQNREAAAVVGISVRRVGLTTCILACALAGVAAATITPLYQATPTLGVLPVIKAFAAVIMGGFGDVRGAIIAAFALGMVEAITIAYITASYSDAIVFGLLILTLLVKPRGLFGTAVRAA